MDLERALEEPRRKQLGEALGGQQHRNSIGQKEHGRGRFGDEEKEKCHGGEPEKRVEVAGAEEGDRDGADEALEGGPRGGRGVGNYFSHGAGGSGGDGGVGDGVGGVGGGGVGWYIYTAC